MLGLPKGDCADLRLNSKYHHEYILDPLSIYEVVPNRLPERFIESIGQACLLDERTGLAHIIGKKSSERE